MQRLANLVKAQRQRVTSMVERYGPPPPDKLVKFIARYIVPPFKAATEGAPDAVLESFSTAFESANWSWADNAAAAEDVTIDGLLAALASLESQYPVKKRAWARVSGGGAAAAGGGSGSGAGAAGDAKEDEAEEAEEDPLATAVLEPSSEELADIGKACTKMWDLDFNRLEYGKDYVIDLQQGKKPYHTGDSARFPLFTHVDEDVWDIPTFGLFRKLLDNYERETGKAEIVTRAEEAENYAFLRACMHTGPMRYAFRYLVLKGEVEDDEDKFVRRLHDLWFKLYRRERRNDSSGFEHVFVGEERDGKVMGMHNWINLYLEERKGALDYKGYIFPRRRGRGSSEPVDSEQVITIQFSWEGDLKPVSTSFVGVSPEFELAVYTLVFLCSDGEEVHADVGPYSIKVKAYRIGRGMIGTAYPEAKE